MNERSEAPSLQGRAGGEVYLNSVKFTDPYERCSRKRG